MMRWSDVKNFMLIAGLFAMLVGVAIGSLWLTKTVCDWLGIDFIYVWGA